MTAPEHAGSRPVAAPAVNGTRVRFALTLLGMAAGVLGSVALAGLLVWQALDGPARTAARAAVAAQATPLAVLALAHVAAIAWLLRVPLRRYVLPLRRLADDVRVMAVSGQARRVELPADAGPELRDAAAAVDGLVERLGGSSGPALSEPEVSGAWPLQDLEASALLDACAACLADVWVRDCSIDQPEQPVTLQVDAALLLAAVRGLAGVVAAHDPPASAHLALGVDGGLARLDVEWAGDVPPRSVLRAWERTPLLAAAGASPRDIARRHVGEVLASADPGSGRAVVRFLLSVADAGPAEPRAVRLGGAARRHAPPAAPADDAPLDRIAFTVLDTETTGLDPERDEVVSLSAVRVRDGRVDAADCFSELLDPGRPVSAVSTRVHGMDTALLRGRPRLAEVLPAFAGYARGTVLVGHDVDFDLRFLRRCRDDADAHLPEHVLDTLRLAALAQPSSADLSLDAVARRLGIAVVGRHTALGDARMTAGVLVRLLGLLHERGIRTLGQARVASARSADALRRR